MRYSSPLLKNTTWLLSATESSRPDVTDIDAAIRKHEKSGLRALHRAGVPAAAAAHDVANVRGRGVDSAI